MGITYTTTATECPVSIEELRLHAHADGYEEDSGIFIYVGAATQLAQRKLDRQLCTATLRMTLDEFPCATRHNPYASIRVPRPPLQSVSVGYVNGNGTTTTMASTDYIVDTSSEPGRITPRYGDVWPTPRDQPGAVTVTFVAGYGAATAVPRNIKTWIMATAAYWYRVREPVSMESATALPMFESLLMSEDYGRV